MISTSTSGTMGVLCGTDTVPSLKGQYYERSYDNSSNS